MKNISLAAILTIIILLTGGCSSQTFDKEKSITVVSREDGSGTREAFIGLFGIEIKDSEGNKKDTTTKETIITTQTNVMMTKISGNKYAVGYTSLGSLNDTVKTIKINDVTASAENIKNGTYEISRPFNIATKGEAAGLVKDFIDYILSSEGQEVISGEKYIPINGSAESYTGNNLSGKIIISGSSSVTPVIEKLKEAYLKINTNAVIEIQQSDSSTGMKDAINGTCDIGMASRDLKDTELANLISYKIAIDGIAVIVNNNNPLENLTKDQVKEIFTGVKTNWNEIIYD